MGQKINLLIKTRINRLDQLGLQRKRFGKYLIEDFQIRKYIKKYRNSGVSEIIIERSSK